MPIKRKIKAQPVCRETSPEYGSQPLKRPLYDLEQRTEEFARAVRSLIKLLPKTMANQEDARQLLRSSGSVAANYIEANESVSKKDFLFRIKISRKEAKESRLWLRLIHVEANTAPETQRLALIQEATELMNILSAIYRKSS